MSDVNAKAGPSSSSASRYAQRALHSIPAPIEYDSDPEFNPKAYIPDPPKRRGLQSKITKRSKAEIVCKRARGSEPSRSISNPTKRTRTNQPLHNPLLEYFHDVIEISSDGDSENDDDEVADEEIEDDEDMSPGEEDERPISPPLRRPAVPLLRSRSLKPSLHLKSGESETEPESDSVDTIPHATLNRNDAKMNIPFASKSEPRDGDSSVTEPESEDNETSTSKFAMSTVKLASASKLHSAGNGDDSVTEPETDDEPSSYSSELPAPAHGAVEPFILDARTQTCVPSSLNKYLRAYQREGVQFLFDRYRAGRGAVLGDDMGLGKTMQVIALLSAIMHKTGTHDDVDRRKKYVSTMMDRPEWRTEKRVPPADERWATALIVAPSSVVGVWSREFPKWGCFEIGLFTGSQEERDQTLHDFCLGRFDVVITSFDLARRDVDRLSNLPWSVLITDEAHRLKNPKSASTIALSSFSWPPAHPIPVHASLLSRSHDPRTGPVRFALTGTAIQNSYAELWTLLDWANPESVGTPKQWAKIVAEPLAAGQAKGCSEEVRVKAAVVAENLRDKLLPKFFLRRTKDIIRNQLPKKVDQVVFCPLTRTQVEVYKNILASEPVENMVRKDERCECGSGLKRKACHHKIDPGDLFKYMATLIKISNHLALILASPTDSPEQVVRNRELSQIAFPEGTAPKYGQAMLRPELCGKWIVLQTLLSEWRKDPSNKVLIFTKSVKLLEMLEFHLKSQHYGFEKLDGSTKPADRMAAIDNFQENPRSFVFLISTLAGGTGLNLTAANKVVVFDPNWNPAHDLQAMDRAYRFGQTRDVSVYRLLGAGSIEELIYARQLYKQQQMAIGYEASVQTRYFSGVSGDKGKQGELFGLRNIFKLHENASTTKIAIEHASISNLDWALMNMATVKTKTSEKKSWIYEAEAKEMKESGDLKGLGALLFDDSVPEVKKDDVERILDASGVKYKHRNDELLAPSRIEKARVKSAIEESKRRAKRAREAEKAPTLPANQPPRFEWPPKRRQATPKDKLAVRQRALIDLGYVQMPEDVPKFALVFEKKSEQEQMDILMRLDEHAARKR